MKRKERESIVKDVSCAMVTYIANNPKFQLKYIKKSFLQEIAIKYNVSVDEVKELFRTRKISIVSDNLVQSCKEEKEEES
ncbi:MAG: hypothetical protein ACTSRR_09855 [Candidatus Heimdallarchaeaceae archaeon]